MRRRLSIIACGLLANLWVASTAFSQAPVIDLSKGAANATNAGKPATVEGRISRIERLLDNQTLVDLTLRLESLQQEMQRMFGEVEVITHDIKSIKRRQRDLYLDIDRRFQKLEGTDDSQAGGGSGHDKFSQSGSGSGTTVVPIVGSSTGKSTSAPVSDVQIQKAAYQRAFGLLREGKYDQAKTKFNGFVVKYPKSEYADNAQYWLGEVNYVQRNFGAAIKEFKKVMVNYPESSKFADALLKTGLSEYELANWDQASRAFSRLIKIDPNTSEAQLAKKKLQKIKMQKN